MTSEKMNQLIPQRKEVSTCLPYLPPSDSRITVPNQPNIMYIRTAKPNATTHRPGATSLTHIAAPPPRHSNASEPKIGKYDGSGMKYFSTCDVIGFASRTN